MTSFASLPMRSTSAWSPGWAPSNPLHFTGGQSAIHACRGDARRSRRNSHDECTRGAGGERARRARLAAVRLAALESMKMHELRQLWAETFGHATASHNHAYLRKKFAWRLQELAEGGLSQRARERIAELTPFAPIRHRAPSHPSPRPTPTRARDPRLPTVGTVLARAYQGARDLRAVS